MVPSRLVVRETAAGGKEKKEVVGKKKSERRLERG
jgi:hypothetical protein